MLADMNSEELQVLASAAASLEIDAQKYRGFEIQSIAFALQEGATLKIHNPESLSENEVREILWKKRAQIIFTISNMTTDSVRALAFMGAGLEVDAKQFSDYEIQMIAFGLQGGATLKICNPGSMGNLRDIVATKSSRITLA